MSAAMSAVPLDRRDRIRHAWTAALLLPLSLIGSALPACGGKTPAPDALNVVLISIDTLRADHLSAYGYSRETSPRIDELAAAGILFEQAYSQSPRTAPRT
jgi:glucan phosphoethanolaminetransferase (alkaline phosphatase superfamily)